MRDANRAMFNAMFPRNRIQFLGNPHMVICTGYALKRWRRRKFHPPFRKKISRPVYEPDPNVMVWDDGQSVMGHPATIMAIKYRLAKEGLAW